MSAAHPPPVLSGGLPVLGHTVEFLRRGVDLLFRAQRELGEAAAFRVLNRRMVGCFGPEAHRAVFRAPDHVLSAAEAYKMMTPIFGKGIAYDAAPEITTEQLRMLVPALSERLMSTYGDAVVDETESLLSAWGDSGRLDLPPFCRELTSRTSTRCLVGREFREALSDDFTRCYRDLERGVTPLAFLKADLPVPAFVRRDRARRRLVDMTKTVVADRRRAGRGEEDFLQTLMEARYDHGGALSEDEITGILLAGLFAGHHTSAVTTAWTLLELVRHPSELAAVREEIDAIAPVGQPLDLITLRRLVRTESAIKEALRLHPPLFMLVRVAKTSFTFGQWQVPAGTWLVVSPTVSHRMAEVFPEPDRFDPSRFLPPRREDAREFAYIAFGGGHHRCLGSAFALLQIKAILARLVGRYDFAASGDPIRSDYRGLVVGPKDPCRLSYRRRV